MEELHDKFTKDNISYFVSSLEFNHGAKIMDYNINERDRQIDPYHTSSQTIFIVENEGDSGVTLAAYSYQTLKKLE